MSYEELELSVVWLYKAVAYLLCAFVVCTGGILAILVL